MAYSVVCLAVMASRFFVCCGAPSTLEAIVEVEEEVYRFENPNNGSGPMWCHGNTCIVRTGDTVYASGVFTIPGAKPLNNCFPLLFLRDGEGWKQIYKGTGRTREPCPVALVPQEGVFLSINPTLTPPDTYGGPAEPRILTFSLKNQKAAPAVLKPTWHGTPAFTEHSYRSFAADGEAGELLSVLISRVKRCKKWQKKYV